MDLSLKTQTEIIISATANKIGRQPQNTDSKSNLQIFTIVWVTISFSPF